MTNYVCRFSIVWIQPLKILIYFCTCCIPLLLYAKCHFYGFLSTFYLNTEQENDNIFDVEIILHFFPLSFRLALIGLAIFLLYFKVTALGCTPTTVHSLLPALWLYFSWFLIATKTTFTTTIWNHLGKCLITFSNYLLL